MNSAKQLADRFVEAARQNPNDRSEIFRRAADTFMGLAMDPKNARASRQLHAIGIEFVGAAHSERPPVMDDFTDILRETETAYNQVGDDPLDLHARRREIHDVNTALGPGEQFITPPSFNRDATLGRTAKIKFNPTEEEIKNDILQIQTVAFWQGVKKEAQAMTVDASLGFSPSVNLPGDIDVNAVAVNARPYGEIEYGSDGNRQKARFDLALGTRFTVVGNYIALTIGMEAPPKNFTSPVITGGASIGAFAAPSIAPVILTVFVDGLGANAATPVIPIPLRAKVLLPLQSNMALNETALLVFYDIGGNTRTIVNYKQDYNQPMQPIPITGDIAFMTVGNQAAVARNFRLPFQLSL